MGEPIASTGRMFVVARRPSRQYRQGASKWIGRTWTSTTVGTIGAFAKMAPKSAHRGSSASATIFPVGTIVDRRSASSWFGSAERSMSLPGAPVHP